MNNEKTMENVRKNRNIKLATTERRRNYFTKLLHHKVFHIIFISNKNQKNSNTYK